MKKIILLITIVMGFSGQIYAKCLSRLLEVFPEAGIIKEDSWIILEGYGRSQEIVNALNKAYPIRLLSEKDTISLALKYLNQGGLGVTQAILMPERKLRIGQKYRLKIDGLDKDDPFLQREFAWTVEAAVTEILPSFIKSPELLEQNVTYFGCGPEVYSTFKIEIKNKARLWVKTELVEQESKQSSTYFLEWKDSAILKVGHGMCYGPFEYKEGRHYKVRFSLMDISGKTNDEWSPWVEFKSPYDAEISRQNTNRLYWGLFGGLLLLVLIVARRRKQLKR